MNDLREELVNHAWWFFDVLIKRKGGKLSMLLTIKKLTVSC